ncbi:DNA gyrase inhibitor YacG [Parerythrobacter lacustris]|uniref:DNA gyrase inhibitor YacG n=1 Tax=Parerythrobacter lacustris TaxID=2969984 RepID=A0ABT1XUW9_9SPHN|nr:DNA gyrase inhibitor YacG [Parerythrobacter lacustris]MCR2835049.1 DNA gyrase inhibitor YacG [Parerythrobacter lacustris]
MTTVKRCPICRKPRVEEHVPFCSTRCRDRDLSRWFNDGYAVPGPPASPEDVVGADGGD